LNMLDLLAPLVESGNRLQPRDHIRGPARAGSVNVNGVKPRFGL